MSVYVVEPPAREGETSAVIVLPEVFGWDGRLKGICDTLAGEGYFVVMPDCHRGTTKDSTDDFLEWVKSYGWENVVKNDFDTLLAFLAERQVTGRVGAIGFCWGAWAFCKASSEGVPLACGVGPHPSTRLEGMMGGDELTMMQAVKMPVLLMPAGNDPDNVKPEGEVAAAIIAAGGASVEFPEMSHGWVSRGDISEAAVARDVEVAMRKGIEYFKTYL